MTLPRTVAEVLADHVVLEVESIDRMYLNVWQPRLPVRRRGGGVLHRSPRAHLRVDRSPGPARTRAPHLAPAAGLAPRAGMASPLPGRLRASSGPPGPPGLTSPDQVTPVSTVTTRTSASPCTPSSATSASPLRQQQPHRQQFVDREMQAANAGH
jgi:hypothetical protein